MPLEYIFGPVVKVPGRTAVIGGMPGWQIALIAAGVALAAATLAVLILCRGSPGPPNVSWNVTLLDSAGREVPFADF